MPQVYLKWEREMLNRPLPSVFSYGQFVLEQPLMGTPVVAGKAGS